MEFEVLLSIAGDEPVFETGLLLAGDEDPSAIRKQLSRWVASGKVHQLRRGLYSLAPPYQKISPHPFLVANRLKRGSYVSLQSALAYYGMIPEGVPTVTSVTTGRPETLHTPIGSFDYRHIQLGWLRGYRSIRLPNGQEAFLASPEKAFLDLVYLQPKADHPAYLRELRLQNLEILDLRKIHQVADEADKPKLRRAVELIGQQMEEEATGFQTL